MTSERQRWWDSLPAEEKRVREDIDEFKRMIKYHKKHLIPYVAFTKYCIRYSKKAIKALRKQIGMLPFIEGYDTEDYLYCPVCHSIIGHLDYLDEKRPRCCDDCGQKLRWFE